jgi:chemotaxis protein MotB
MTEDELREAQSLSETQLNQIALLNQQLSALRQQIAALNEALDAAEAQAEADQVQIADLGERLNAALAAKVQELSRYRSEFFEKLLNALGDQPDIRVVGDRFVLQSELLFDSGSAEIAPEGKTELDKIARLVIELGKDIPSDVRWILRVDGHTDRVPISTALYPSNWELSTARATAVVRYLIERGVPANRLAATGFGEFQPIDPNDDEIALRRNRRIEFKLTEQ